MKQSNDNTIKVSVPGSYLLLGSKKKTEEYLQRLIGEVKAKWEDIKLVKPEDSKGKTLITSIEQIKEAQKFINLTPIGKVKIIAFSDAASMPAPSANALLKLLEEPPKYGLVVLQSSSENLLPTITSRCQKVLLWEASEATDEWDFDAILEEPFYKQSTLLAKIAEEQQSLNFLAAFEQWARVRLRKLKDKQSSALIREIINAKRDIKGNLIPRVVLESLILRFTHHV